MAPLWQHLSESLGIRVLHGITLFSTLDYLGTVPSTPNGLIRALGGHGGRVWMAASCPSLPVGQSCPCSPWTGPVPVAVGEGSLMCSGPQRSPSWLSLRPTLGSPFADESCWPVVSSQYVCACVQKQTSKCLVSVLGKIVRSRLPRFAYMFLFLSYLLCTCVISILERLSFSYPNCSLLTAESVQFSTNNTEQ